MAFLRKAWPPATASHHGKRWHFDNIIIEPRPVQQPHPPLWMGAGSFESIRVRRRGIYLLLDQIAPIDLIIERVATYRQELERLGRPYRPGMTARPARCRSSRPRRTRTGLCAQTKVLKAIGGLARGPGAERYQNISSHVDPNLASEESALLGTPEEIIARPKKLGGGRRRLRAAGRSDRLERGVAHVRRGDHARTPTLPRARVRRQPANDEQGGRQWKHRLAGALP
jgi:alkanesulfonate monooxygenase SsuD/methylene tetrahydromethanopterin reductase-like flavin-dependent oxidoreductase (luciferase family)